MVNIVSLNVRGLANERKRRSIFKACRDRAQIILLQETHSSLNDEPIWKNEWGGKIIFSHAKTNSRGTCIMFRKDLNYKVVKETIDDDGRFIIVEINIDEVNLVICNIYAPNSDTPAFFHKIANSLMSYNENKIVIGDFNLTMDVDLDRMNTYCNNNKSMHVVEQIIQRYSLEDVWRVRNPDEKQYSWFKINKREQKASRIDLALTDKGLNVENVTFFPVANTDHQAIFLAIKTHKGKERGVGYWKFNNMLLHDPEFVAYINEKLENITLNEDDPIPCWIELKNKIVKFCQTYSRRKSRDDKIAISQLLEVISSMRLQLPLNEDQNQIYVNSIQDLEELQDKYIQGIIFRSKAKWYGEGEKNTRYFLSLERAQYNAKVCNELIDQGITYNDFDSILKKQTEFYTELYTSDPEIKFSLKNYENFFIPENLVINTNFVEKEVTVALRNLNNNKTPGEDGLSADFYKMFWKYLCPYFMSMLQTSYELKFVHSDMKTGILNLIPKEKKDTRFLKNLRPITVLNTDYKIIEKCISNRLKVALPFIINHDQTGFMSDRRISSNI